MKNNYEVKVSIPEGINCSMIADSLQCSKGSTQILREFKLNNIKMSVNNKEIIIVCDTTNRKGKSNVNAYVAHIKNIFHGLKEKFVYEMEICNVHFPMTVKVEKDNLAISNFLGEKVPRSAKILPGVEVKVEGTKIKVSGANVEGVGQTAANIEAATKVTKKDRRIFQDGIFITKKPGANE